MTRAGDGSSLPVPGGGGGGSGGVFPSAGSSMDPSSVEDFGGAPVVLTPSLRPY